jgi:hypothetical protein
MRGLDTVAAEPAERFPRRGPLASAGVLARVHAHVLAHVLVSAVGGVLASLVDRVLASVLAGELASVLARVLVEGSLVQAGALRLQLVYEQPPHLHYEHLGLFVQHLGTVYLLKGLCLSLSTPVKFI